MSIKKDIVMMNMRLILFELSSKAEVYTPLVYKVHLRHNSPTLYSWRCETPDLGYI